MTVRQWLFIVLVLVALLVLGSCSSKATSTPSSAGVGTTKPAQPQDVKTPTPTPTPQVTVIPEYVCDKDNQHCVQADNLFITITLPWQGQPLKIEELPITPVPPLKGEGFTPFRAFINFEVTDGKTNVGKFDPEHPMVIVAQYTDDDAQQAGGAEKLKLGFYDEKRKIWRPIEKTSVNTDTKTITGAVSEWGDRHIGPGD